VNCIDAIHETSVTFAPGPCRCRSSRSRPGRRAERAPSRRRGALDAFVLNVKEPFALMLSLLPPLFWSTRPVPVRPATVPPTL